MRYAPQKVQEQLAACRTKSEILKGRIAGFERQWEDELAKAAMGLHSNPNSVMGNIEDARQELVQIQATIRGLKRLLLESEEKYAEFRVETACNS
jgi:hypothetical protein